MTTELTIGAINPGYGGLPIGVAAALGGATLAWHAHPGQPADCPGRTVMRYHHPRADAHTRLNAFPPMVDVLTINGFSDWVVTGGALMRTCKNADPNAARVNGRPTPGDELRMRDMTVTGDILHEDPERDCRVYMTSTCLTGAIQNAYVSMDQGSRWYATGDSNVILSDTVETAQIDAPAGITIHAKAADGAGEYTLSSGGKLIVEA